MRGAAKHFNTAADVENSLRVDAEGTKKVLRSLLEGRMIWVDAGALASGAKGVTDDTHKVVAMSEGEGSENQVVRQHQFVLQEDPNAWIFQIGLTVEKINEYLEA